MIKFEGDFFSAFYCEIELTADWRGSDQSVSIFDFGVGDEKKKNDWLMAIKYVLPMNYQWTPNFPLDPFFYVEPT